MLSSVQLSGTKPLKAIVNSKFDRMKVLLIVLSFFCIRLYGLEAQAVSQSVIASDGGSGKGAGVQLDYTLGELAVDRLTGQQVSMTEGFQQPFLRIENVESSLSGPEQSIDDAAESMITLTPNPVKSELMVRFGQPAPGAVLLEVRDANGVRVLQKQLEPVHGDSPVDVSGFSPGVYYFHFTGADQRIQSTYKISKIQ